MSVEILESKEPVTEQQLAQLEEQLGRKLPPAYRAFLLKHNGGYPVPDTFDLPEMGADADGMVDRFLAIHDGEHSNLYDYLETYAGRLPPNLFPVAHDPGGNVICISVDGEDSGQVYFWDHEEEAEDGETPTFENVYLIADDFDAFLDGLHEGEE